MGAPCKLSPSLNCSLGLNGEINGAMMAAVVIIVMKIRERRADLRRSILRKVVMISDPQDCMRLSGLEQIF